MFSRIFLYRYSSKISLVASLNLTLLFVNHCWNATLQRQNTEILKQIFPKRNIRVSVPISTFMRLWAIYIFPRSVWLFCWRKYVDPSWDFIIRSQTHECWNWGWGRAIPRKGIHKWDFRCSVLSNWSTFSCLHSAVDAGKNPANHGFRDTEEGHRYDF